MRGVIRKGLGLAVGLLLLVPASALAGQASVVDGIARYDAYFGETNTVTVAELAGPNTATKIVRFVDVVAIPSAGASARTRTRRGPSTASCRTPAGWCVPASGTATTGSRRAPRDR